MVEVQAGSYRAVVDEDYTLKVFDAGRPGVPVVHGTLTGEGLNVDSIEYIKPPEHYPVFTATWAGGGRCNLDLDCGAQRWSGMKSMVALRRALLKCGFEKEAVSKLLTAMKHGGPSDYCPRFY